MKLAVSTEVEHIGTGAARSEAIGIGTEAGRLGMFTEVKLEVLPEEEMRMDTSKAIRRRQSRCPQSLTLALNNTIIRTSPHLLILIFNNNIHNTYITRNYRRRCSTRSHRAPTPSRLRNLRCACNRLTHNRRISNRRSSNKHTGTRNS